MPYSRVKCWSACPLPSIALFTMVRWAIRAVGRFGARKISEAPLEMPWFPLPRYYISLGGVGMSFVPASAFWIWGQFYLFRGMEASVSRAVLTVQAIWFLLGCVVAVVNGAGQWLRERRTPHREGPE